MFRMKLQYWKKKKSTNQMIALFFFFLSIFFILYGTLLCREPRGYREYNFQLFWSYQKFFDTDQPQAGQIIGNILLFMPVGMLIPFVVSDEKRNRKGLLPITLALAGLLSSTIEILQFFLELGFAELDDIFDNTLGAFIGTILIVAFMKKEE